MFADHCCTLILEERPRALPPQRVRLVRQRLGFRHRRGNDRSGRRLPGARVDSVHTATVQEVHLVALHVLCAAFEVALERPVIARRAVA